LHVCTLDFHGTAFFLHFNDSKVLSLSFYGRASLFFCKKLISRLFNYFAFLRYSSCSSS
ncbi:unnamed protein product, partial [Arabidopsis halleri]